MTTTDTAQAVYDNLIAAKPGDVFSFEQAPGQRVLIVVATAQLADPDEEPKASGGPVTNPPAIGEDGCVMPRTCGFAFVGNVGEFTCDRYVHTDSWHWDSLAEFGWHDPEPQPEGQCGVCRGSGRIPGLLKFRSPCAMCGGTGKAAANSAVEPSNELCSDKNGFHDGHYWTTDPSEPHGYCPGYPLPKGPVTR